MNCNKGNWEINCPGEKNYRQGRMGHREDNYTKELVTQSCLTLCDPMDYNLPGSSVHGILQARILEWIAIPFSRGSSQPREPPTLQADSLLSEPLGKPRYTKTLL